MRRAEDDDDEGGSFSLGGSTRKPGLRRALLTVRMLTCGRNGFFFFAKAPAEGRARRIAPPYFSLDILFANAIKLSSSFNSPVKKIPFFSVPISPRRKYSSKRTVLTEFHYTLTYYRSVYHFASVVVHCNSRLAHTTYLTRTITGIPIALEINNLHDSVAL